MNNKLVYEALLASYELLCSEQETVCDECLHEEFERVLFLLKKAMDEVLLELKNTYL